MGLASLKDLNPLNSTVAALYPSVRLETSCRALPNDFLAEKLQRWGEMHIVSYDVYCDAVISINNFVKNENNIAQPSTQRYAMFLVSS